MTGRWRRGLQDCRSGSPGGFAESVSEADRIQAGVQELCGGQS